jgi:hypothetical protein
VTRAVGGLRGKFSAVAGQSERSILLGTILLASAVAIATGFVLAQYYSVDALSSLIFVPDDCYLNWAMKVGRHCFSDYTMPVTFGMRDNPWLPYPVYTHTGFKLAYNNYPAAGMVPQLLFGVLGKWLGAPQLGLFGYQLALTVACFTPGVWAARGALGLERLVVFLACGFAAIPAWMTIDRGNSVGFAVPVMLVFLVALSRQRWGLVAIMVVLAALVKPQFVVLVVVLFAARQWRPAGIALGGVLLSNVAAYALWPRDFPETITESIHNTFGYGAGSFQASIANFNVSFAKGLLSLPDSIKAQEAGGKVPDGFLAAPRSMIGYAVLLLVVVSILILGRRIAPVMAGIVLLATASLFAALSLPYYLVFALPVAALVVRDPDGPPGTGIFDRLAATGDRRRAVGVLVSFAAALSIAQVALPSAPVTAGDITGQMGTLGTVDPRMVVVTTVLFASVLWLVTCAAIIVSYARRPVATAASERSDGNDDAPAEDDAAADAPDGDSSLAEAMTEFAPQGLA